MSYDEQRIAIAEACGWKCVIEKRGELWQGEKLDGTVNLIPDYLNDLNAMHEAEHFLEFQYNGPWFGDENSTWAPEAYMYHLQEIEKNDDWCFMGATAAQRAEAFLRTLNLWTESKPDVTAKEEKL